VTQKRVAVNGAGRTDAGVHAAGQAASFRAALKLGEADLFRALNAVLPDDVRVLSLTPAPPDFHARRSAVSKTYEYRVVTSRLISPFDFRFALHVPQRLSAAMRRATSLFVREDFSAFVQPRR
jgi:tRNA pseudouridine38-40 synthase